MSSSTYDPARPRTGAVVVGDAAAPEQSAVSWAAIIAGAVVACAASLILIAVGAGLGFSSISPWHDEGISAGTLGLMTVVWLIVVQWVASGVGGYVTGRLRTRWLSVHHDEVFFRDTAHGLLAWAIATLFTVGLLASAVTGAVSTAGRVAGSVGEGATQVASSVAGAVSPYDMDTLFRSAQPGGTNAPNPNGETNEQATQEVMTIVANAISTGQLPAGDRDYLAQLVAARTGVSVDDARTRVDQTFTKAREAAQRAQEAADTARKAAAKLALFTALAMLIGAFVASAGAAYGGSLRDDHH
ncbi:hypothetical protein [Roseococcus pinisoli]|uniref:hypothetical protein n=1 Tax=Roseococcus pinisoli TaxID=2835040 RepID=UPI0020C0D566|nr:hypothetical protein [Roseococcus pinisoli]